MKIIEGVTIIFRRFTTKDWEIDVNLGLKDGKIVDLEVVRAVNLNLQTEILKATMIDTIFEEKKFYII